MPHNYGINERISTILRTHTHQMYTRCINGKCIFTTTATSHIRSYVRVLLRNINKCSHLTPSTFRLRLFIFFISESVISIYQIWHEIHIIHANVKNNNWKASPNHKFIHTASERLSTTHTHTLYLSPSVCLSLSRSLLHSISVRETNSHLLVCIHIIQNSRW